MSSSLENPIFEAQLVETNPANPFASPTANTTTALTGDVWISDGIGRASQEKIDEVNNNVVNSEIAFVAVCFASAAPWLASGVGVIAPWLWLASLILAAFFFGRMIESCNGFNLTTVAMVIGFLIPVVGCLIYFSGKRQAFHFLIWNGYRPEFLGAKPNEYEIELMNKNPNFRPSAFRTPQGRRRRMPWTLSSFGVPIYLAVTIVFAIFQP